MPRRDTDDPSQLYVYEVNLVRLASERSETDPPGFYGYEAVQILGLSEAMIENGTIYKALARLSTLGYLEKQDPTLENNRGIARRRYTLGIKGAELLGREAHPITWV